MRQSDNLYKLIRSLTKTEKAYFKKFASRHVIGEQNKYVFLFDAVAASKNGYDEREIKRKYHREKFVKNFPVIKNYLYEMILKSLNSFYYGLSTENKIRNEIRNIEILYKKALFSDCTRSLNRALKQAYKTQNFLVILELLKWKKNLIHEGAFKGNDFVNLETAYNGEQDIIKKLKNQSDYRMLSYRARSLIVGTNPYKTSSISKKEELLKILDTPLLQSECHALSYQALVTYFHVRAILFESLNRNLDALEYRKQLIRLMEEHPEGLEQNLTNYIVSVYNLLGSCLALKLYDELEYYINKLRSLEKTYPKKISANDRLLTFVGSTMYELRMNISRGQFSKQIQNLIEIEKGLEEFDKKIVKVDELHFFYLLAYGYFGSGKFSEALKWVNKILNDKDASKDSRLIIITKILNLIIHYELGNLELLDYLIKSAYRYFKKSLLIGMEEKVVIQFLKHLPDISTQAQLETLFERTLNHLKALSQSKSMGNTRGQFVGQSEIQSNFSGIAEFDLESWLESKITGKQFADVMKAKPAQYLDGRRILL